MEFYNYTGMKKQTADQSAKVVEKYRKQFAHNMEMYNYTDKGKKSMIMDLGFNPCYIQSYTCTQVKGYKEWLLAKFQSLF